MNVENLRHNYPKLISFMETAGYSNNYIGRLQWEIERILVEVHTKGWDYYNDVYRHCSNPPVPGQARKKARDYRCHHGVRSSQKLS